MKVRYVLALVPLALIAVVAVIPDPPQHLVVAPPAVALADDGSFTPDLPAEVMVAHQEALRIDLELAYLTAMEAERVAEEARQEAARAATRAATVPISAPRPAVPPAPPIAASLADGGIHAHPALICIRRRESDRSDVNGNGLHDGGYEAYNPGGPYLGAFQFLQSTWNSTASSAGRGDLVGRDPRWVAWQDQDAMAWHLYQQAGSGPWGGTC